MSNDIGTLKISNAQTNDIGNYLVLAENKAGKDQTYCRLSLKQLPNVDQTPYVNPDSFKFLEPKKGAEPRPDRDQEKYRPPVVIVPLLNLRISEGDSVKFECKIDGYPKPKVLDSKKYYMNG